MRDWLPCSRAGRTRWKAASFDWEGVLPNRDAALTELFSAVRKAESVVAGCLRFFTVQEPPKKERKHRDTNVSKNLHISFALLRLTGPKPILGAAPCNFAVHSQVYWNMDVPWFLCALHVTAEGPFLTHCSRRELDGPLVATVFNELQWRLSTEELTQRCMCSAFYISEGIPVPV